MEQSIKVPSKAGYGEIVEKRSKFIANIDFVESEKDAIKFINKIKAKYHDARHNIYAYILDNYVKYSDDGEPQGSAGMPVLNMLQKEKVNNVCCVVTRYFGGILLGTGGLSRAYSLAAKTALDNAGFSYIQNYNKIFLKCSYDRFELIKRIAAQHCCKIDTVEYSQEISLQILAHYDNADNFITAVKNATSGLVIPQIIGQVKKKL